MKIALITKIDREGILSGTIPSVQSFAYWYNSGYKYIVHQTEDAVTLSKENLGDIGEHCVFLPPVRLIK